MIYRDKNRTPRERAQDLLSRLSLKEKVGQVNQRLYGFSSYTVKGEEIELTPEFKEEVERCGGLGVLYGLYRADPWSRRDFTSGLYGKNMIRAYNKIQRYVIEHSRFGIPMLMSSECPHGHQALGGYLLPVNLAAGAAWNPALLREAYEICGRQLKGLGVDFALISMLDILRDPRWGRSEECYSEDPYLASRLAFAAVSGCQSAGVGVVAKHFCAQGETTGGVNASAARIGERELREIHLPAVKACCEAKAAGVMAAYNEIDGMFCHANRRLLNDILRKELGFDGAVMADGVAIDRLNSITGSFEASAALALSSGVDISLWDEAFSHLEEAVEHGLVSEERLDEAVLRVLELKFERGLFDDPYLEEKEPESFTYEKYPQSLELARQSAVLLKNDGILPLKDKKMKIAVIGPNADSIYNQLGDYTPPLREGEGITLLSGLRGIYGAENVSFAQGCSVCGTDTEGIEEAVKLAERADIVILALGGSSSRFAGARFDTNGAAVMDGEVQMDCGEGVDCSTLELPGRQAELAQAVFGTGKPVVTVFIAGRAYAVGDICEKTNAAIYSFYPGPMGGRALAEIISGAVSPSGRLPASLPRGVGQLPCYYNAKASYDPMRYCDEKNSTLYSFGFGLSYTGFELSDIAFPGNIGKAEMESGARAELRFKIRNVGEADSYAVPQLFIKDMQSSTVRRVKELKAFDKLFIKAGESAECKLSLGVEELSVWDAEMKFTLEAGDFELYLEESGVKHAQAVFTVEK